SFNGTDSGASCSRRSLHRSLFLSGNPSITPARDSGRSFSRPPAPITFEGTKTTISLTLIARLSMASFGIALVRRFKTAEASLRQLQQIGRVWRLRRWTRGPVVRYLHLVSRSQLGGLPRADQSLNPIEPLRPNKPLQLTGRRFGACAALQPPASRVRG